jgi:homoserine/homoserine lactone efflux protein
MDILTFVLVSAGIIVIPGPNVLVIISTSISHGKLRGLQTVAGTTCAMILQLFAAALGTAWLVSVLSSGFLWIKWLGVSYLIYLGVTHLFAATVKSNKKKVPSAMGSFQRGFWVSLTNPKTILFFSAFLPQFVSGSGSYLSEIALLSTIFLVLAVVLDSGYAILSGKISTRLSNPLATRYQNLFSGIMFLGAGALLGTAEVARK